MYEEDSSSMEQFNTCKKMVPDDLQSPIQNGISYFSPKSKKEDVKTPKKYEEAI